jgi:hypothetical protein
VFRYPAPCYDDNQQGFVVAEENLNKVADGIAIAIRQLVDDLESREKNGEILKAAEVHAVANQLQTHLANLLTAVRRLREEKPGK